MIILYNYICLVGVKVGETPKGKAVWVPFLSKHPLIAEVRDVYSLTRKKRGMIF